MSTPTIAMRASATALVLATIAAAPAIAQPQDVIGGIPVIDKLDVNRLPRGQLTRYWFKGSETNTGQGLYIPVIVARGAEDGPRLLLNSGIHGDELNGIRVVQTVMAELDLATLKGTIIGIPGLNRSGILNGNRRMYLSAGGGSNDDLNRIMPGTEDKGDAGARYNGRIWNRLWAGNVDMMIDLHTQGTGMEYPLFVYADVRLDKVRALAEAIAPDIIKYDPGEPGSVETEFDKVKIPAITFEIGRAKTWQQDKIIRAIAGVRRVLVTFNMTPPPATPGPAATTPIVTNELVTIKATVGGFVEPQVALLAKVTKDQLLATQRNNFGDIVAEYKAPYDAYVLSISSEPTKEPGAELIELLRWNPSDACKLGC